MTSRPDTARQTRRIVMERVETLVRLQRATKELEAARALYEELLAAAIGEGHSERAIGEAAGISGVAVHNRKAAHGGEIVNGPSEEGALLRERIEWERANPRPDSLRRAERAIVRALKAEGFGAQSQVTRDDGFEIAVDDLFVRVELLPEFEREFSQDSDRPQHTPDTEE